MFKFINSKGKPVWVKLSTVICIYQQDDGDYVIQTIGSIWITSERWAFQLLAKLQDRDTAENNKQDDDWWKHGRPNPLDSEEEE